MSQLLKYLILIFVSVFLGLGLGVIVERSSFLMQHIMHLSVPVAAPTQNGPATQKQQKQQKDQKPKEAPKSPPEKNKNDSDQSVSKDESLMYLRALWPVKKGGHQDSFEKKGTTYFEGTNPYGPPPSYKEDLLASANTLTPSLKEQSSYKQCAKEQKVFKEEIQAPKPTRYQIEFGRFSLLSSAEEARNFVCHKGYNAVIYYRPPLNTARWFHVRLKELFSKPHAQQKSKAITLMESLMPTVVEVELDSRIFEG